MRKDKNTALALREAGKSYNEIQQLLGIPKSTLSFWLSGLQLSNDAQQRLKKRATKGTEHLIERNKQQTVDAEKRALTIRKESLKKTLRISKREHFLIGVSLYWGEGYKKGGDGSTWRAVDFANSDPYLIAFMMRFFREHCAVKDEKFRIQLMLHDKKNEKRSRRFWSTLTKLPLSQFYKTSLAISSKSKGKRPKNRLPYGTVHIRINDVRLFFTLIGYIDGLKQPITLPK